MKQKVFKRAETLFYQRLLCSPKKIACSMMDRVRYRMSGEYQFRLVNIKNKAAHYVLYFLTSKCKIQPLWPVKYSV